MEFKKNNWLLQLSVIGIVVFLFGCASSNTLDLTQVDLKDALKIAAEKNQVCNLSIAIIKNKKITSTDSITGCVSASEMSSKSVFQAASLSKPVFGYAVLKLIEEGKLDLDTPVVKYLPQGYRHPYNPLKSEPSDKVIDPRIQLITIRMILSHSSGLPNWASGPLSFNSEPGTKWDYSGEGFLLLQRAVEVVTDMPLDKYMLEKVFKPLGMNNSSFVWNESVERNLILGTKANTKPRAMFLFKEPISSFTLYTNAEDYGKFISVVLNDEKLLKSIIKSPIVVDENLNLSWGLGWGIENTQDDVYIWHWGNNPGYRAFVIASLKTGDGFVFFTNSENGLSLARPIAEKIMQNHIKLFQFSMLEDDVINLLCKSVHLCF